MSFAKIIVFLTILSFCQLKVQPFSKAQPSNENKSQEQDSQQNQPQIKNKQKKDSNVLSTESLNAKLAEVSARGFAELEPPVVGDSAASK